MNTDDQSQALSYRAYTKDISFNADMCLVHVIASAVNGLQNRARLH